MAGVKGRSGRQPERFFRQALLLALEGASGRQVRAIAEKLVAMAAAGDLGAIREVIDRIDGKARQQVDLEADGMLTVLVKRLTHD